MSSVSNEVSHEGSGFTDLYDLDGNGWKHYKFKELNLDQCKEVANKCSSEAKWERAKSIGWAGLGVAGALVMMALAFTVTKITAVVLGIALLPVAPILPLYIILCLTGAAAAGGVFGFFTLRAIYKKVVPSAGANWNHANHLANQASRAADRMIQLKKSS